MLHGFARRGRSRQTTVDGAGASPGQDADIRHRPRPHRIPLRQRADRVSRRDRTGAVSGAACGRAAYLAVIGSTIAALASQQTASTQKPVATGLHSCNPDPCCEGLKERTSPTETPTEFTASAQ